MARPADPHARSAVSAAARAEFVRHGIQKARIEDITAACGLSKGAFYLHYDSKESLFAELVKQLENVVETHRKEREEAHTAFLAAHGPVRPRDLKPDSEFVRELAAVEARQDRALLEILWEWRDVIDVLLRGAQGTGFEGVMWSILDRESAQVQVECSTLKHMGLVREDIDGDLLGMMVVGTYLLVARKLSTLEEKPDFDQWVLALRDLLAQGTMPRLDLTPKRKRAPARRATTATLQKARSKR